MTYLGFHIGAVMLTGLQPYEAEAVTQEAETEAKTHEDEAKTHQAEAEV